MAKGNLSACLDVTLSHEGGYTNDRRDPGNWTGGNVGVGVLKGTNMGIAANTYPDLDIKNLKKSDVLPLYEKRYWRGVNGEALPYGVDLAVFDYGVNSGPSRAVKALQAQVGAKVDGVPGAETIIKASSENGKSVIQGVCARRLSFMRGLKIWETFKRGWSRRVADVEAKAVAMWLVHAKGATGSSVSRDLREESNKASKAAGDQNKAAGGVTTGGAGVGGGDALVSGEPNWMLIAGVAVIVVVVAGVLILKARQNRERAAAYAAVAAS